MTTETPRQEITPEYIESLTQRLRGEIRIPITDGLGPADGEEPDNPNEFVRKFPVPPINLEAAAVIEELVDTVLKLKQIAKDIIKDADEWSAHTDATMEKIAEIVSKGGKT